MGGPAVKQARQTIVVVGGSFVGVHVAQKLAHACHKTHRVLIIEKNSHFQYLFAFPRYSVTAGSLHPTWTLTSGSGDGTGAIDKRKAFIPFTHTFKDAPEGSGEVIHACATDVSRRKVKLDRSVELDGCQVDEISYEFLVIATGTRLTPPSTLPTMDKIGGLRYLATHVEQVEKSKKIVIIGGGAVGIQLLTDICELFPKKSVTLVHSRKHVMNTFHPKLHEIIEKRAKVLGADLVLGHRVNVPKDGFPNSGDGSTFEITFQDGAPPLEAEFAIVATGQTPQSQVVQSLAPHCIDDKGFINVRKTLQLDDPNLSNVFALGDVANTGGHKAARPGFFQADVVVSNITSMIAGTAAITEYMPATAGIHLSLGINENIVFRNPAEDGGEPEVLTFDNGRLDCWIDAEWKRRAVGEEYDL